MQVFKTKFQSNGLFLCEYSWQGFILNVHIYLNIEMKGFPCSKLIRYLLLCSKREKQRICSDPIIS